MDLNITDICRVREFILKKFFFLKQKKNIKSRWFRLAYTLHFKDTFQQNGLVNQVQEINQMVKSRNKKYVEFVLNNMVSLTVKMIVVFCPT